MSLTRLTLVMLSGVGPAVLHGSALSAAQEPAAPAEAASQRPDVNETLPPVPPPKSGQEFRGRFPPRALRQPLRRGAPADGIPNRPGRPNRAGRPDSPGPWRFGPPGGPPRWPYHNWEALQKNDPEMFKLSMEDLDMERRTRELAIQYRRAPQRQRTAIKEELEQVVDKHFEVRQQRRRLELKQLEEELQRLRGTIERRNKARVELVGKRISQLLGEDENLDF